MHKHDRLATHSATQLLKRLRNFNWRRRAVIRDTDADWQQIGRAEPFFGVLTNPKFLRSNMDEAAEREFFQDGEQEITRHLQLLRKHFGTFNPVTALDFGCGVGRLTRALASTVQHAVGVDVSEGMLQEARAMQLANASFQRASPDREFDWVVSLITFQHIQPKRGYDILRNTLRRVAVGGCATIQITIFREPRHYGSAGGRLGAGEDLTSISGDSALRSLDVGVMVMFDYDLSIVAAIFIKEGFEELHLTHSDHDGFHGVVIYGRRATTPPV